MYHGKFNARLLSHERKHRDTYIGNTIFSFFFPLIKREKFENCWIDAVMEEKERERFLA